MGITQPATHTRTIPAFTPQPHSFTAHCTYPLRDGQAEFTWVAGYILRLVSCTGSWTRDWSPIPVLTGPSVCCTDEVARITTEVFISNNDMQKHTLLPATYLCGRKSQICQLRCKLLTSFCTVVCHVEKSFPLHTQHTCADNMFSLWGLVLISCSTITCSIAGRHFGTMGSALD